MCVCVCVRLSGLSPHAISLVADFWFRLKKAFSLLLHEHEHRTKHYKIPWQCDKCAISSVRTLYILHVYSSYVRLLCNWTQLSTTLLYHFTCLHMNFLSVYMNDGNKHMQTKRKQQQQQQQHTGKKSENENEP